MFKYILSLAFFMSLNLPSLAGYTFEGFKSEDTDLEGVAKGIAQLQGSAPSGWEIDQQKTVWQHSVADNIDGTNDCVLCIKDEKMFIGRRLLGSEPRDIDPKVLVKIKRNLFKDENPTKISVKRDVDNNIVCTIESEDSVDYGGALIHYFYSKQMTLKKKSSS